MKCYRDPLFRRGKLECSNICSFQFYLTKNISCEKYKNYSSAFNRKDDEGILKYIKLLPNYYLKVRDYNMHT
jgi:hypothetical protein